MKTRWFTNPIWLYSWVWILTFFVYQLKWSGHYNTLSKQIISFFLVTVFLSFFLGYILEINKRNRFKKIEVSNHNLILILSLWFGYILEFFYSGGIPLLLVFKGSFGNYRDFTGIPTFHVVLATFNIFLGVYFFHQYLSCGKKNILLFFILTVLPNFLVLNRGAIMITLIACLIIYLMKLYIVRIINIGKIVSAILLVLFFFGQLGNMRSELSADSKEYILSLGGATDEFIEGNVPFEYYWGYLYIASPLGNLDNLVSTYDPEKDIYSFPRLIFEFAPDFISNKLREIFHHGKDEHTKSGYLVVESLNAPTVYFGSYFVLGWAGIWAMYIFSMCSTICYLFILPISGKYYTTGFGILSSIVILNIFNNMWVSSGTILIWPLLFTLLDRIEIRSNGKKIN